MMMCYLQVVLMMLEKDERHHMTQLFEHLSATKSTQFTKNDVQNLANKYIWPSHPATCCMSCSTTALGSMQNTAQELNTQKQEAAEWAIQWIWVGSLYSSVCYCDSIRNLFFSPECFAVQLYFYTTMNHLRFLTGIQWDTVDLSP